MEEKRESLHLEPQVVFLLPYLLVKGEGRGRKGGTAVSSRARVISSHPPTLEGRKDGRNAKSIIQRGRF